jgi:aspartate kinase
MIVLKFGGTSVGNAARVREAAGIALAQSAPRVVVVSAAGGVTNLLLDAGRAAAQGQPERVQAAVETIHDKHDEILDGVPNELERARASAVVEQLHAELDARLAAVARAGAFDAAASDAVVSTGERCLSTLMAATLRALGHDAVAVFANEVIATDDRHGHARPDLARTTTQAEEVVRPLLEAGQTVVMTGFIGGAPDGSITTLGRGGSDYSATILGAALQADEVQIWTDVPGVLTADPRQVTGARVVAEINYEEAQELAHFGAKVLHPRTIRPAVARDIPVRILSTFEPQAAGTTVTNRDTSKHVKAVTALRGLIVLTLGVPEMEDLARAAAVVFRRLHEHGVEILTVNQASSRRQMTFLVDAVTGGCSLLKARLAEELDALGADVECREHVAVLAAVGQGAAGQARTLARMLDVLARAGVPVLAANQQASNVALLAVVPEADAPRGVAAVHDAMVHRPHATTHRRRPRRTTLLAEPLRVG